MRLCVIRVLVSLMILTKMHSPLSQLGPSTSVTTYRLLLLSVYHVATAGIRSAGLPIVGSLGRLTATDPAR